MSWQSINHFIMTWLDPIGVVTGLLMLIPVVWGWWAVTFGRRRIAWHREIRNQPGNRAAILIIDLLPGKEIRQQVERFRQGENDLKGISEDRIFHLCRARQLTPDDMPGLQESLQETAAEIHAAGIDTLHCFFAGPAIAAALIGREFANACRVLLYQHDHGTYLNYGPLHMAENP